MPCTVKRTPPNAHPPAHALHGQTHPTRRAPPGTYPARSDLLDPPRAQWALEEIANTTDERLRERRAYYGEPFFLTLGQALRQLLPAVDYDFEHTVHVTLKVALSHPPLPCCPTSSLQPAAAAPLTLPPLDLSVAPFVCPTGTPHNLSYQQPPQTRFKFPMPRLPYFSSLGNRLLDFQLWLHQRVGSNRQEDGERRRRQRLLWHVEQRQRQHDRRKGTDSTCLRM